MRDLRLYIFFALCVFLSGCERVESPDNSSAQVKLYAKMGVQLAVDSNTKADGIITSTTESELNIGVVRLDEKTNDADTPNYPYFINCGSPLTATLGVPDEKDSYLRIVSDFSTPQFFKNSVDKITYAAWYPWPKEATQGYEYSSGEEGTTVKLPIPATGDSDIMYANVVEGDMSEGFDVMEFNHALSLFRIYAYSSTGVIDWGSIVSLSLTSVPDVCTIKLPASEESAGYDISYSNSEENPDGIIIKYDNDDGIEIPEGFDNKKLIKEWIAAPTLPADAGSDPVRMLNITVVTKSGESTTTNTSSISVARNFQSGCAYDIVLRFSDQGVINAEAQISDWESGGDINSDVSISETFYNLSANGTANCYIVSSANFSYCFDATVKGNGNSDAFGGGLDATLSPTYADVIWSEVPEFVLATHKIKEGKVMFRLEGNDGESDKSLKSEGNVLVGVYDKEGGNCLWTWHIWITDYPQKQNYTKGYIVLDRNLGATAPEPEGDSSEGMKGLFYQWGRPTPFHLVTKGSGKSVEATKSYTRVTPDVAVANPLILYGRFDSNSAETEVGDNASLDNVNNDYHDWVDRTVFAKVNNLWGYREVEHVQPIKTMYDPCPPGYHVPYSRNWLNMERYWTQEERFKDATDKQAFWAGLDGINFYIENSDIWYPFQGYINKDGEYSEGHVHMYEDGEGNLTYERDQTPIVEVWSSLINRHTDEDEGLTDETVNDSPYRFLFTRDHGSLLSDQYSNRSRGLAVRCVSDNTANVVKDLSASQTANCYMIHSDGYYKFKVTVRGNGVGSLLPLGGTTTAEINGGLSTSISPAKVDILWWQGDFTNGEIDFPAAETSQTTAPKNMCLSLLDNGVISSDGYASFQVTGFSKGNAILAAYDEIGNILWTWHIWFTDKPLDKISGNYTKQDRFLGATYAPTIPESGTIEWPAGAQQATLGFYYQWGRKDPIIGPPGYTTSIGSSGTDNTATASSERVSSSGWWKNEEDGWHYYLSVPVESSASIPDVVKNPIAFYRSTTKQGATSSQWFPQSFADGYTNVALWGYAVADYSIEGQTFSKTMHDPCPPGYRTPFHFSWRYNSTYKYAEGDLGEARTTLTAAETGFSGWGIVTNKNYFEKMWYPFVGYRDPLTGGYVEVGTTGYMNTGMPMGQYNTRTFWYNSTYTGQHAGGYGSAYGMMVRCMKE